MSHPDTETRPDTTVQPDPGRRAALVMAGGLAVLAWVVLLVWDASAYARWLDHDALADELTGAPLVGVFLAGWVLMVAAMMLPTTWPVQRAFARVVRQRSDRGHLIAALATGYVATWLLAGLVALSADTYLHLVEDALPVLGREPWLLSAVALAVAGAFQFSDLKDRCLDRCRSPRMVVMAGWHGRRPLAEALRMGIDHGASCVGCCWALMLVMFGVGAGSLGWMLLLGAAMAAEKVLPWGGRLTPVLGILLLASAGATAVVGLGA